MSGGDGGDDIFLGENDANSKALAVVTLSDKERNAIWIANRIRAIVSQNKKEFRTFEIMNTTSRNGAEVRRVRVTAPCIVIPHDLAFELDTNPSILKKLNEGFPMTDQFSIRQDRGDDFLIDKYGMRVDEIEKSPTIIWISTDRNGYIPDEYGMAEVFVAESRFDDIYRHDGYTCYLKFIRGHVAVSTDKELGSAVATPYLNSLYIMKELAGKKYPNKNTIRAYMRRRKYPEVVITTPNMSVLHTGFTFDFRGNEDTKTLLIGIFNDGKTRNMVNLKMGVIFKDGYFDSIKMNGVRYPGDSQIIKFVNALEGYDPVRELRKYLEKEYLYTYEFYRGRSTTRKYDPSLNDIGIVTDDSEEEKEESDSEDEDEESSVEEDIAKDVGEAIDYSKAKARLFKINSRGIEFEVRAVCIKIDEDLAEEITSPIIVTPSIVGSIGNVSTTYKKPSQLKVQVMDMDNIFSTNMPIKFNLFIQEMKIWKSTNGKFYIPFGTIKFKSPDEVFLARVENGIVMATTSQRFRGISKWIDYVKSAGGTDEKEEESDDDKIWAEGIYRKTMLEAGAQRSMLSKGRHRQHFDEMKLERRARTRMRN